MKPLAVILAALALTGCAREPGTLECSIDDTPVFVAYGVSRWYASGDTVTAHSEDGRLVRRMEPNETCREYVL